MVLDRGIVSIGKDSIHLSNRRGLASWNLMQVAYFCSIICTMEYLICLNSYDGGELVSTNTMNPSLSLFLHGYVERGSNYTVMTVHRTFTRWRSWATPRLL